MNQDMVSQFLNKQVKIQFINDFHLKGQITACDEKSLVFETSQTSSIIDYSQILNIRAVE